VPAISNFRVTDYVTLAQALERYLNRDSLTHEIPMFVQLAEAMFNREIRWRFMVAQDVIDDPGLTDEVYENLPADYLELKSIRFNTVPRITPDYLTPRQLELYRQMNHGASGTPRHYTIEGNRILFDRVPSGSPELDISSYVKIPTILPDPGAATSTTALTLGQTGTHVLTTQPHPAHDIAAASRIRLSNAADLSQYMEGAVDFYTAAATNNLQVVIDTVLGGTSSVSSWIITPVGSGTNLLLTEHPDIYVFGSLMQAETFLKNDPRLATWTALYQNAKDRLHEADRRAERSPGPLTVRSRRCF
jgi:hypothetical protein